MKMVNFGPNIKNIGLMEPYRQGALAHQNLINFEHFLLQRG
jgi:hypothetical protein